MFRKKRTTIVAAYADTHPNSNVGLLHPDGITLDADQHIAPSPAQLWLWERWARYWDRVTKLKREHRATVYAVQVGDGCDDNTHSKAGLITPNKATITRLSKDILEPVLDVSDRLFVIRGTEAHSGQDGELEEILAQEVGAVPDGYQFSIWRRRIAAAGVVFDVAHHPRSSSQLPWTVGGGANRQAAYLVYEYAQSGDEFPHVALRAHVHHLEDSGHNHPIRAFFLPPWQLCTAYGFRRGYKIEPIGGLIFICNDGHYSVEVMTYMPERGKIWRE